MKHVWIYVLSTWFSTFSTVLHVIRVPMFFSFSEVSSLFVQSSSHYILQIQQLWLIIKAIFLHPGWIIAMEYLTKYLSYNCHHLLHLFFFYCRRKESYDLHNIKIERSKFRYLSWVHPKYRSDELRPKIIISVVKYALANLLTSAAVG